MSLIIFDLDILDRSQNSHNHIDYGVDRAIDIQNVYDGIVKTTRAIHGLPRSFSDVDLADLSIYIGRSSPSNILGRFIGHRNKKCVSYGIIVGSTPTEEIEGVEDLIVRLIVKLKDAGTLCVGDILNRGNGSFGPLPSDDKSLIYICFSTESRRDQHGLPTPSKLHTISEEIVEETYSEVTPRSLRAAMEIIRQRSKVIASRFHPDHLD